MSSLLDGTQQPEDNDKDTKTRVRSIQNTISTNHSPDNNNDNNGSGIININHNNNTMSHHPYRVTQWNRSFHGYYSDMIHSGMIYLQQQEEEETNNKEKDHSVTTTTATATTTTTTVDSNIGTDATSTNTKRKKTVVMLYESPSSSCTKTSFFNGNQYKFHDYPPADPIHKTLLAPQRYSMMNGSTYPIYLQDQLNERFLKHGLLQHWIKYIPDYDNIQHQPIVVSNINVHDPNELVYGYLPVETLPNNINDPTVHYHLCGKDAIPLMTTKTPKVLSNTYDVRPCICKTTHSMGSKGIFIIRNDKDSIEFEQFLKESNQPSYIITEFIDIQRNIACHFFIHPNCTDIIWIGSNENLWDPVTNTWSKDSTIDYNAQEELQQLQLPFVYDVVTYMLKHHTNKPFWGFVGIDVLIDHNNQGWLVDVNPRCTGSSPAIMLFYILYNSIDHQCAKCLFRRTSKYCYHGTPEQLWNEIDTFNADQITNNNDVTKRIIVIVASLAPYDSTGKQQSDTSPNCTLVQLGAYGGANVSIQECENVLNQFTVLTKSIA